MSYIDPKTRQLAHNISRAQARATAGSARCFNEGRLGLCVEEATRIWMGDVPSEEIDRRRQRDDYDAFRIIQIIPRSVFGPNLRPREINTNNIGEI